MTCVCLVYANNILMKYKDEIIRFPCIKDKLARMRLLLSISCFLVFVFQAHKVRAETYNPYYKVAQPRGDILGSGGPQAVGLGGPYGPGVQYGPGTAGGPPALGLSFGGSQRPAGPALGISPIKPVKISKPPPRAIGVPKTVVVPKKIIQGPNKTVGHGKGYFPSKKQYGSKGPVYKKVANVGPLTQFCPFGWDEYHGSCYYFSRDRLSWYDASMKCSYMGGILAVVNEPHENSYLKVMCNKNKMNDGAWFGLNDVLFSKTHTWYWDYGKTQCNWFDWFGNGPNLKGPHHDCVLFSEGYKYQWKVENCRRKRYYICEMNPKRPCKCSY